MTDVNNALDQIKVDLSRMTYLVDAIRKSQDTELIKEAKKLRKDIKHQFKLIKDEFESHETGLFDALTEKE